jgi:glutamine---fructose-6-phosphate transaminase (isomerizing)
MKEVTGIHAEAVSAAEILHGPIALAGPNTPALLLGAGDESEVSLQEAAHRLHAAGSPVFSSCLRNAYGVSLPCVATERPALRLMGSLQTFYSFLPKLAIGRGREPDSPLGLTKITRTT